MEVFKVKFHIWVKEINLDKLTCCIFRNGITLGPAYNDHFNAQRSARSNWVIDVTELFSIEVNDRFLAQQRSIWS